MGVIMGVVFFYPLFIAAALQNRKDGVFAEAWVGFGPVAHNEKAALGASDDFDMHAAGA
jgi:hypothetical protein